MKKFAMVPINFKEIEDKKLLVRRVLISYRFKTHKKSTFDGVRWTFYHGTKILSYDNYFKKSDSSHQYVFYDKDYVLKEANNINRIIYDLKPIIYSRRKYHGLTGSCEDKYPTVIEFKAKTKEEAIKILKEREELR